MDSVMTLLGWIGGALYLFAYLSLVKGWVQGIAYRFHLANIASGSCLAISCAYFGAIPSMAINIVFVAIGLYYIFQKSRQNSRLAMISAEESRFQSTSAANQSLEAA